MIFSEVPCNVLVTWTQEWEDYGEFGFGDVNGQPLRSGYYQSFDWEGVNPVGSSLREVLSQVITDPEQLKTVVRVIDRWIESNTAGIETLDDLADVFEVEGGLCVIEEVEDG